jgi:hypothetical protein
MGVGVEAGVAEIEGESEESASEVVDAIYVSLEWL